MQLSSREFRSGEEEIKREILEISRERQCLIFNMVIIVMAPFMIADLLIVLCQTISHELLNIYLIFSVEDF